MIKLFTFKRCHIVWLTFSLLLALSGWLRWRYLWVPGFHYDEGHWLMFGVLANAGFPAYTQTFVGIPPLALLTIQLGEYLFGVTLAVRYPMIFYSLVGIGSMFWLFRPHKSQFGLLAGVLSASFLSFAPVYFTESVSIMAEAPAVALSLLALLLLQQYYFSGKQRWLWLSGLTFALSLSLKIFVVFFPMLTGLLILLALQKHQQYLILLMGLIVRDVMVWLLGVSVPLIIFLIIYSPAAIVQQVLSFRFALRDATLQAYPGNFFVDNLTWLGQMLAGHGLLLLGALLGIFIGWRRYWFETLVWTAWFILSGLILVWHIPLRDRYFLMLLPALAALTGIFMAHGTLWFSDILRVDERAGKPAAGALITTLALIFVGASSFYAGKLAFNPVSDNTPDYLFDNFSLDRNSAVSYAHQNTTEDDCIVTDDQRVALAVNRLVPPWLSETSYARVLTGWLLASDDIVSAINANDCPVVVYAAERFQRRMPGLSEKLRDSYFLEITYTDQAVVYAAKKQVHRQPQQLIKTQIGDSIVLQGIDLTPTPWQAGQQIYLAAYWTATSPPPDSYKIFLQLRNSQGEAVVGYDHFPFPAPDARYQFMPENAAAYQIIPHLNLSTYTPADIAIYPERGMVPTTVWSVGNTLREVTMLKIPPKLPPGEYALYTGMYNPDTLVRLSVNNRLNRDDEILLARIQVLK